MRFFTNRTRVAANVVTLFLASAFFTYFFLLTLFEQQVLGYSPLRGGLSYLPFGVGIGAGIGISTALMPRLGVKPLLSAGFIGSAAGLLMTSWIHPGASYAAGVLPGMIVLGLSSGLCFPAGVNAAPHQVTGQDASLASGVQNATQQAGGALGLACLVTLALRHAAGQIRHGVPAPAAATHGYALSFRIGAALLAADALLVLILLEHVTAQPRNPVAELSPDPSLTAPPRAPVCPVAGARDSRDH